MATDPLQLGLFGAPTEQGAVPLCPDQAELAAALPPGLRLGTSSWTFPGWGGLLYQGRPSAERLVHEGLRAYARCPLLRTVGVDRSHYAVQSAEQWAALAAQVPADFRFLVKAHEACTLHRYPDHPRYGTRRGQRNPLFCSARWAADEVVGPAVEGLGERLGVLLFQFAPQPLAELGGPQRFAERLRGLLEGLPAGVQVAVELRNPSLLTPDYAAVLRQTGALHTLLAHPTLPRLEVQARLTGALEQEALVVRWMLRRDQDYEQAVARYSPFSALVAPDPVVRAGIVSLLRAAGGRPAWVIVNNKAEGCAPRSVELLARALAPQGTSSAPPASPSE